MTPCPPLLELTAWKDGNLDSPRFEEISVHVESCPTCLNLLGGMKRARGADTLMDHLEQIKRLPETEDFPQELLEKLSLLESIPRVSNLPFEAVLPFTKAHGESGDWGGAGVYQLLAPLAYGGMGLIFLARHEKLNRQVAVKFLKPELLPIPNAQARFLIEAQAMASIDHPYLVPILDAGEVGGLPYLVMPLLLGETLAERLLRESPLPLQTVIKMGQEICVALGYLHDLNLVHRDIKPSNLWLQADTGMVRLGDLGIVLPNRPENDKITAPGTILGTPGFQAPEIIQGRDASPKSDLFSLGATLFEALAGRSPFNRKDWGSVIEEIALKKLPRVRQFCPEVPQELDDLIARMLEKDPEKRPASAQEVANILGKYQAQKNATFPERFSTRRQWLMAAGSLTLGIAGTVAFREFSRSKQAPTSTDTLFTHYGKLSGHAGRISSLVFSPDGNTLHSTGAENSVHSWNWRKLASLPSFTPRLGGFLNLAISPNGENLACLSENDRITTVFNVGKTDGAFKTLTFQTAFPVAAAFHSSSEWLAIGALDNSGSRHFSKLSTISVEKKLRNQIDLGNGRITSMVFHTTKAILYLSIGDALEAWTLDELTGTRSWNSATQLPVKRLLITNDGETLYAASFGTLFQYSTAGALLGTFKGHCGLPLDMTLLDNGKTLAILEDKALSLWNTATRELKVRKELPAMDPLGPAAFHPAGDCIAYASGITICIDSLLHRV